MNEAGLLDVFLFIYLLPSDFFPYECCSLFFWVEKGHKYVISFPLKRAA